MTKTQAMNHTRDKRMNIRIQLNRFLNSFCFIEIAAEGPEWETAINEKMMPTLVPRHILKQNRNAIKKSEKVKVANKKSLEIWRKADPDKEEVEEAKALLSKKGYRALRTRHPLLAESLFASIQASERAWRTRIPLLAELREQIYAELPTQLGQREQPVNRTFHVALVEAYQDLGTGRGLRSEINQQDPNLILIGTIKLGHLQTLLDRLESIIGEPASPRIVPQNREEERCG